MVSLQHIPRHGSKKCGYRPSFNAIALFTQGNINKVLAVHQLPEAAVYVPGKLVRPAREIFYCCCYIKIKPKLAIGTLSMHKLQSWFPISLDKLQLEEGTKFLGTSFCIRLSHLRVSYYLVDQVGRCVDGEKGCGESDIKYCRCCKKKTQCF